MLIPHATKERQYVAQGRTFIFGVDEAGRGSLAGPVVAAAVVFDWSDESFRRKLKGLVRDSKLLTRHGRKTAVERIRELALGWGIGTVHAPEIDRLNILQANLVAMRYALQAADHSPVVETSIALLDGVHTVPMVEMAQESIIDGDARVFSIAAASIIAKEYRDQWMERISEEYPKYLFAKHKGYGTKDHYEALRLYGLTPQHRRTFLKNVSNQHLS